MVTGDRAACVEGKALLGDGLTTVAVKVGLGVTSARMVPPVRARELVEAGAQQALSDLKAVPPYDPGKPCEIKVEYKWTGPAESSATAQASSSSIRARSSRARTTGGPPGRSSSSRRGRGSWHNR